MQPKYQQRIRFLDSSYLWTTVKWTDPQMNEEIVDDAKGFSIDKLHWPLCFKKKNE